MSAYIEQFTGMNFFYFLNCFFMYSFWGWIFECIVMSYEEKKPVNRGFIKGPFCIIYGAGALGVYFLFSPIAEHKILIFLAGAFLATVFEIFVALLMTKLFGYFWWNYNNKKFNYKGVVCLESTICWGVMSLFTFLIFQPFVEKIVNSYYGICGKAVAIILLVYYIIDFSKSFRRAQVEKEERLNNNTADYAQFTFDDILGND